MSQDAMAENSGKVSGGVKAFRVLLAIIQGFALYGLFFWRSGDLIDKPFYGDHFSGDVFDILAIIFHIAAFLFWSGLADVVLSKVTKGKAGSVYTYGSKGEYAKTTWIAAGLMLLAFVLPYFM